MLQFDYSKLKGKIIEEYGSYGAFANAMGITQGQISKRLDGVVSWRSADIFKACRLLHIPIAKAHIYFFTVKV